MQFFLWRGNPSPLTRFALITASILLVQIAVLAALLASGVLDLPGFLIGAGAGCLVMLLAVALRPWLARIKDLRRPALGRAAPPAPQDDAKYRSLVEDLPLLICRFTPDGTLSFVNPAYCDYFGVSSRELVGRQFAPLVFPDDRQFVDEKFHSLSRANPVTTYEHRVILASGEVRWQRWTDRAIYVGERLVEYQSIGEDITDHKLAEDALRESEEKYRDLFDNATDLIQCVSPDGSFIFVNRAWLDTLGYSSEEIYTLSLWDVVEAGSQALLRDAFTRALTGETVRQVALTLKARDGRLVLVEGNANCMFEDGKPVYTRGIFRDVTEAKRAEDQLKHDAYYDQLTGLPNRALFLERLATTLERARRHHESRYAVLMIDLDRFKIVNESLGHSVGDQLLVSIASRLKECVRSSDTVARQSGDEFVILLDEISDPLFATQVADRIQEELNHAFRLGGRSIFTTASIGIVLSQTPYERAEDVLRDADTAMYRAKALGKARYVLFEPELRGWAIERLELESDLRRALKDDQFVVYYQPIISLKTCSITGFEALVRWKHPRRGLVPPSEFIPIAEETGMIIPLGSWVMREACLQLSRWQKKFPGDTPLTMSVNLSGRQLVEPELVERVRAIITEAGIDPNTLALEITESSLMENVEAAAAIFRLLRQLGVQLQIDDFGTGYSSLGHLQHFPINTIKIDRAFVSQMGEKGSNSEIVRTIMLLGQQLGMDTTAEGVETAEQLAQLRALECKYGQGYYFSRPLDSTSIERLIGEGLTYILNN